MAFQITAFNNQLLLYIRLSYDEEKAKAIIKRENLYNATDNTKNTLLHIAAESNNASLSKYLIDSGSRIDAQNDFGQTPLMFAVTSNSVKTIDILLRYGASIEVQDYLGNSALHMIGKHDQADDDVLQLFLLKLQNDYSNMKEKIAMKLFDSKWSLHKIIRLKDVNLTKILLQRGYAAEIDSTDISRNTALHIAVKTTDLENIKLLVEYNANVNIADLNKKTPIMYVYDKSSNETCPDKKCQILKMLLDRGAFFPKKYFDTGDAGYKMFQYGNREAIKLLLETDTKLFTEMNVDCVRVVHAIASNRNPGVIEEIRGKKFDLCLTNGRGLLNFMTAAGNGNPDTVKFLLDTAAKVEGFNGRNFTDIFNSIIRCTRDQKREQQYKECVMILLERNANEQSEYNRLDYLRIFRNILKKNNYLVAELVLSDLALQQKQALLIDERVCAKIDSHDHLNNYFELCKEKLEMKVYNSITLYDLLAGSDKKIELYARNAELTSKIEDFIILSEYYYFCAILKKRLPKAICIVKLKKEAGHIICWIMQTNYERFPLIADTIVDYLEQCDIKNLLDAYV